MKSKMKPHLTTRSWHYVVPPDNIVHIIINEHVIRDSRGSTLYSRFYVSAEVWRATDQRWHYIPDSTKGCFKNFKDAFEMASFMWSKVKKTGNLQLPTL